MMSIFIPALIMAKPHWEFTQFIWWMQTESQAAACNQIIFAIAQLILDICCPRKNYYYHYNNYYYDYN